MKSRRTRGRYVPELRPTIIYTRGVRKVHIQRAIRKICFPRFSIKKKDMYVKSFPSSHPFLLRRDRHTSHSIRTWRTPISCFDGKRNWNLFILANSPILNSYRDVSRDDKGNGFKDLVWISRFSGFRGRRREKRKISFWIRDRFHERIFRTHPVDGGSAYQRPTISRIHGLNATNIPKLKRAGDPANHSRNNVYNGQK